MLCIRTPCARNRRGMSGAMPKAINARMPTPFALPSWFAKIAMASPGTSQR